VNRHLCSRFALVVLASASFLGACGPSSRPAPPRPFSTLDLLIRPNEVNPQWEVIAVPAAIRCSLRDFLYCLEASTTEARHDNTTTDHIVAQFESPRDAARAYRDRGLAHDTLGEYASTWSAPAGFTYVSPIADQFRAMCETTRGMPPDLALCVVEARYEEYFSIVFYTGPSRQTAVEEMEMLARAVDAVMETHLKD